MMTNSTIYQDIVTRTAGDIYIGVVGPVRTGKSTFIKSFMEQLVLPNIEDMYLRERAKDELPQSGSGRTIMTAEPKFVPEEAVRIQLENTVGFDLRLIDCVGYMVDGAMGQMEGEQPRMVHTPWFEQEIPLAQAAEVGTRKVITEHSTIGIVVTTDGSFSDIPREDYAAAEERIIRELQEIRKPFCILLNSVQPAADSTRDLQKTLEETYGVTCIAANCQTLSRGEIEEILAAVLYEFPAREYRISLPPWVTMLPADHPLAGAPVFPAAQLEGAPFIMFRETADFEISRFLGRISYTPSTRYTVSDDHTLLSMVEQGLGIGITHSLIAENPRYRVVCKHFDVEQHRDIGIATAKDARLTTAVRLFIDHVCRSLGENT